MVRGDQSQNVDPYRTLGLEPGASMAEVKRAYRLLAKAFHPDSAGEAALPRFLAIHEAYEQLKAGRVPAGPRTSRPPAAPSAEPWRADPARARAARERARTARSRTGTAGASAAGASGAAGGTGGTHGTGANGGASRSQGRPTSTSSGAGATGRSGRRQVRKATMGSTSYDDARDIADATWSGASWYGPSTGEYWIVNPREYADPRKHGPDYQSRTRRPADGAGFESVSAQGGVRATGASAARARAGFAGSTTAPRAAPAVRVSTAGRVPPTNDPAATAAGQAASRATWAQASTSQAWRPDVHSPRPTEAALDGDPLAALEAASRGWLGGSTDDPIRRLGLALVAWPPIGLAAATLIGDVTGCSVYSASCAGSAPLLPWLAQAAILGFLLLLPPVTRILAGGAVGVLLALVPITLFLVAVGGTGAPQAGYVLAVLLGAAWLVGVAWATRASPGRVGTVRTGP